jgi:hypothetical protein
LPKHDLGKMKANADGIVTLYVGPKPPEGFESNWIPTRGSAHIVPGRFGGHGFSDLFFYRA